MKNIAIFASGSGTNAQRIVEYFAANNEINICRIYSNNIDAFVLTRAENLKIPTLTFSRDAFINSDIVIKCLVEDNTDFIVLAGFLWLVPQNILGLFNNRIINIHPALLPKYGGKGMYGSKVHEAIIANNETESGITIHFVNDKYDDGQILFQARCKLENDETPDSLAKKIHELEYKYFPEVIEKQIKLL